ncbi:MAG TPA: 3'-5' exonuclease [Clostridiales bacterium]|nr:3'-5' exonuclease [Clostridiales bacterium]
MRYLFFDSEHATSVANNIKICEFGYVLTDENFKVLQRKNFIINPKILRKEWDWYAVRKILTRKPADYVKNPSFPHYYPAIKKVINNADYIIGHNLARDVQALNDDCKRYKLPSLDYEFYDIQEFYKSYHNISDKSSLENLLKAFNIEGDNNLHDAEADAYNTMLVMEAMLKNWNLTFDEIIQTFKKTKDKTKNYLVYSIEKANIKKAKKEKIKREKAIEKIG